MKRVFQIIEKARRYSNYYKSLYSSFREVNSIDEFRKLPLTTQNDFKNKNFDFLTIPVTCAYRIFATGGTTGNPKIVIHDRNFFIKGLGRVARRVFAEMHLTSDHLAFNFLPFTGLTIGAPGTISMLDSFGISTVGIGMDVIPQMVITLLKKFNKYPKVFFVFPSHFIVLTEQLKKLTDLKEFNITHIITGGEPLYENTRSELQNAWGCQVFAQYASTEVGPIAWECKEKNGLHLIEESVYTEILDLKDNKKILDEGEGMVVVTSLWEESMPFIRYQIGEIAEISSFPCKCGWNTPKIWIKGRVDELIILAGAVKLFPSDFCKVLREFPEISDRFQLEINKVDNKESLLFRIETSVFNNKEALSKIEKSLIEKLSKVSQDLAEVIYQDKLIEIPKIEFLPIGSLERTRIGKLKNQIIDKRL